MNNLDFIFHKRQRPHPTTVWRQATNQFLRRPDLHIDSLVSVPNAMTKRVVDVIDAGQLAPWIQELSGGTDPLLFLVLQTDRFT